MPSQSQYATCDQMLQLAITQAAMQRFTSIGAPSMDSLLQAASSFADGYIGVQFTLPLQVPDPDAVPAIEQGWDMSLTMCVCAIAAYWAYCQYGFNPNAAADQLIEKRYEMWMQWLRDIAADDGVSPPWIDSSAGGSLTDSGVVSDVPIGFTSQERRDSLCGDGYADSFWTGLH